MTVIRHHENSECLKRKGEKGKINKTKTKNKKQKTKLTLLFIFFKIDNNFSSFPNLLIKKNRSENCEKLKIYFQSI